MPTTSINDNNISPIAQDLLGGNLDLEITYGLVEAKRIDYPYGAGVSLVKGEWGVLQADGTIARATSTPAKASFLVFAGNDRYDSRATGMLTMIVNSAIVAKTVYYDDTASLAPGDGLTVKLLAVGANSGKSGLAKASGAEPVHAYVNYVSGGVLVYDVAPR